MANAARAWLYIANTNAIIVDELKSVATGAYINDATVVATIKDSAGTALTGETWPVTLSYDSGGTGRYVGTVSKDVSVSVGDRVTAEITATSGSNTGFWSLPMRVTDRLG